MCRTVHALFQTAVCGIQMLVRVFMTIILMIENLIRMILQTLYNFISFMLQMLSLIPICIVFLLTARLKCFMCGGGGACPVARGGTCDCVMSALAVFVVFLIFRATGVLDKIFYRMGYAKATFMPLPPDGIQFTRPEPETLATTTLAQNISEITSSHQDGMNFSDGSLPGGLNGGDGSLPGGLNGGDGSLPGGLNFGDGSLPGGLNFGDGSLPGGLNFGDGSFPGGLNGGRSSDPDDFNSRRTQGISGTQETTTGNSGRMGKEIIEETTASEVNHTPGQIIANEFTDTLLQTNAEYDNDRKIAKTNKIRKTVSMLKSLTNMSTTKSVSLLRNIVNAVVNEEVEEDYQTTVLFYLVTD